MKKLIFVLLVMGCVVSKITLADDAMEKVYLQQVLNQLNVMQPLIIAASRAQPKNTRVEFHYTRYIDAQGHWHNGLLEDVQTIKQGIEEKLNQPIIEPRAVNPIAGDYVEKPNKG